MAIFNWTFNMPFKLILRRFDVVFWCLEWEMLHLFERLMEFHSNPPILYYGFKNTLRIHLRLQSSLNSPNLGHLLSSLLVLRTSCHHWTSTVCLPEFTDCIRSFNLQHQSQTRTNAQCLLEDYHPDNLSLLCCKQFKMISMKLKL